MAGLFDTLDTASRGLQVVQRGIATTGNNVANVNTPGYSRQRAVLRTTPPQRDPSGNIGTGVEQVSVERIVDQFAQLRLVAETSRMGALDTTASAYRAVESIVNDQQIEGLGDDLSGFFDALDALAGSAEPGQPLERSQLLAAAQRLVDTIRRYDTQLRDLQRGADRAITSMLPGVNELTREIAELNREIAQTDAIAPANDLRDRRDEAILALAEKIDVQVLETGNGMVSVGLAGGLSLVEGGRAFELRAVVDPANPNPLDPTFSQVHLDNGGVLTDVTARLLGGGELGGQIEARDAIVTGALRDLDAFAYGLSESFNAVHRAGLGLVDGTANDFFLDLGAQPSVDDSARNFGLAAAVDPAQGGDPANIAAGSTPVAGGGGEAAAGDTTHVELLKDLRSQAVPAYLAGDVPGTPTGSPRSLLAQVDAFVGEIGQRAQATERSLAQQELVLSGVRDRRDEVSGVNIDEEVTTLVQLQASFQANARVITTVNRLLDELLSAF